jgi:hypothetical protein
MTATWSVRKHTDVRPKSGKDTRAWRPLAQTESIGNGTKENLVARQRHAPDMDVIDFRDRGIDAIGYPKDCPEPVVRTINSAPCTLE